MKVYRLRSLFFPCELGIRFFLAPDVAVVAIDDNAASNRTDQLLAGTGIVHLPSNGCSTRRGPIFVVQEC